MTFCQDWFVNTPTQKIALAYNYLTKSEYYLEQVDEEFKIFSVINEDEGSNYYTRDLVHVIKFGNDFDHSVFQVKSVYN